MANPHRPSDRPHSGTAETGDGHDMREALIRDINLCRFRPFSGYEHNSTEAMVESLLAKGWVLR
jgi:hypothetical protein